MPTARVSALLLVRSLELGGAERQLVELAIGLKARGHTATVAVFYKRGPLLAELERAGVPIIDLRKKQRWDVLPFLVRAVKALRRTGADVIYSFLGGANIVAAAMRLFRRRTKLVWSIRASDMDLARYDWLHSVAYFVECRASRAANLIISNSSAGREFAATRGFPRDRINVVPNGIDTARFQPDAKVRTKQRHEWGLSGEEIAVGVLARLDPMKGHEYFLRAAARICLSRGDVRFFCIGGGPQEGSLRALSKELNIADKVVFAGATLDPKAALNALDIYCSSSLFGEGFSNAVAEAMACGLPCVVTDVGDSAVIVGGEGTVVPRSDADALAAAIEEQVNRLADHDSARPRARIVNNYSVDQMVDGTLALLQQLS